MAQYKVTKEQLKIIGELKKDARPLLSLAVGCFASGTPFEIKFNSKDFLLDFNEYQELDLLKYLAGDDTITFYVGANSYAR